MSHGSSTTTTPTTAAAAATTTSSNGGTISSTGKLRQFVCVEYPGHVENVENMISTLGGLEKISEVSLALSHLTHFVCVHVQTVGQQRVKRECYLVEGLFQVNSS